MYNYLENNVFRNYNFKLHRIIDMHSKYDKMHKNGMFYALICINIHVIISISCILSKLGSDVDKVSKF